MDPAKGHHYRPVTASTRILAPFWFSHSEEGPGDALRLPAYQPIPGVDSDTELIEVPAAALHPTQWCIGLAEIWSREKDFAEETRQERLDYLRGKPVPLIRSASGALWMLDRHHRLRGLLGIDPHATTWGYVIRELHRQPKCRAGFSSTTGLVVSVRWTGDWSTTGRGAAPVPAES